MADDSDAVLSWIAELNRTGATGLIPVGCMLRVVGVNIFLTGTASLRGEDRSSSGIVLDGTLPDPAKYFINAGIPSIRGEPRAWQGFISNMTIRTSASAGPVNYVVMLHYVQNVQVSHVLFDYTSLNKGQTYPKASVEGFNNVAYSSKSNSRERIRIFSNEIRAKQDQDGGEGFGVNFGRHIWIYDNVVRGVGDDPVALHNSSDFEIYGNRLYSTDGRIYLGSSKNGRVYGNHIERVPGGSTGTYYGGGAYIHAEIEDGVRLPQVPTNIEIKRNTLVVPPAEFKPALYGIRVRGGRNINIEENTLFSDSPSPLAAGISIEPQFALNGWRDPDGVDSGTVAISRDVRVHRNVAKGKYPQSIAMGGDPTAFRNTVITDNAASAFTTYFSRPDDLRFSGNATTARDARGFLNVVYTADTPVVQEFSSEFFGGGIQEGPNFQVQRYLRIVGFRTTSTPAVENGTIVLEISINGAPWVRVDTVATKGPRVSSTRQNPLYTLKPRDTFRLRLAASQLAKSEVMKARVEVLGLYE